jgi:hypothetical protein
MKLKFALVAALLLLTSACADLAAVQDYAKASASVPGYDEATKEFGSHFTRVEVYLDEKGRKTAQALAPAREQAVPALLAVHKNLQTYMLVLGKLAGAQTFNLDKQTEGLQKAVVAFPPFGLDADTANAAGTLGRLAAKWVLLGIQQQYVIELVTEADPSIQTVTAGMRRIVEFYGKTLANERREVEAVYEHNRLFISAAYPSVSPSRERLLAVLSEDHFREKATEFTARAAKLGELDKALEKIAYGHAELRRNVNNLSSREFATALKAIAQDIWAAKGQIDKLN